MTRAWLVLPGKGSPSWRLGKGETGKRPSSDQSRVRTLVSIALHVLSRAPAPASSGVGFESLLCPFASCVALSSYAPSLNRFSYL